MESITYSLINTNSNSEQYYREIKLLADEVLIKAQSQITNIVDEYVKYISEYKLEEVREKEEYILELLSFGILWRTYSRTAVSVKIAPFHLLTKMAEWRKKHQRIKPFIDLSRGILTSLFLLPEVEDKPITPPTLEQIDHACKWFESTGEFREQALRFIRWRAFWGTLDDAKQKEIFSAIAEFRTWFEHRCNNALDKYTVNVDPFLDKYKSKYKWREDRISCSRTKVEYHLNMVGAELMNRAFRKKFLNTEAKAVLLPGCMRSKSKEECKAVKEKKGLKCIGCEPKCRVNGIREMGLKGKFEVYVIPHASDLSLWSPKEGQIKKGIVASACVTTLVEGGWELKRYDVPAQCVLLDYCGCKKHWHPEGIETKLNKQELIRILEARLN